MSLRDISNFLQTHFAYLSGNFCLNILFEWNHIRMQAFNARCNCKPSCWTDIFGVVQWFCVCVCALLWAWWRPFVMLIMPFQCTRNEQLNEDTTPEIGYTLILLSSETQRLLLWLSAFFKFFPTFQIIHGVEFQRRKKKKQNDSPTKCENVMSKAKMFGRQPKSQLKRFAMHTISMNRRIVVSHRRWDRHMMI